MFINFDGDCREAVEFYAKVFRTEIGNLMTYSDAPPDPDYAMPEADRNRVLYAGLRLGDITVMFSDCPAGSEFIKGNNVTPTYSVDDKDEVTRIYNELSDGGEVYMELGQTFFSELFGMVEDKFGIIWQILYYAHQA
jgi:PhnB protein